MNMKTNYNIKYLSFLFAMLLFGVSCSDDEKDIYQNGIKEISFKNAKELIVVDLLAPKDTVVKIQVKLSQISSSPILAHVNVDNSLVAAYNKANNTDYKELSSQAYNFNVDKFIIPRYTEESSHAEIRLQTSTLKDADKYLLPVIIETTSGDDNVVMATDSSVLYILFSKKDIPPIPFLYLQDMELTTEIGEGKKNWFSAYATSPDGSHLFSVQEAAEKSEMMDFVLVKHGSAIRFYPSIIGKQHGGAYQTVINPYIKGFRKVTHFCMPGPAANVAPTLADFNAVNTNEDLQNKIAELNKRGYPYYTIDRMASPDIKEGIILVQGWGPMIAKNESFTILHIKEVIPINGGENYTIKFDIKYFGQDVRTEYANMPNQNVVVDNPLYNPDNEITEYKNVELTTEVGDDKKNWFSAYAENGKVAFTQQEARSKSNMMDFVPVVYGDGDVRFNTAIIGKQHGGDYLTKISPYVEGFEKLTYVLLGGHRVGFNDATKPEHYTNVTDMESLDSQITFYRTNGYNYAAANRMTSEKLSIGSVFVFGWGSKIGVNNKFGMAIVRELESTGNSNYKIKMDIKVPRSDARTPNNGSTVDK